MSGRWKIEALKLVPKNLVSRCFGVVSDVRFPGPVQGVVNRTFASFAGINLHESAKSPDDYHSLNAFFTRELKPGLRPVETDDPGALISPVDGCVGTFGKITDNTLIQAKGRTYRLEQLVDSEVEASSFEHGHYMTIYLSPRDYHRIHSPAGGVVSKVSYVPGYLFPVNPLAVDNVDDLFAVNERLISYLDTAKLGRVALVKVGATCVGRIALKYSEFITNQRFRLRQDFCPSGEVQLNPGDEMAAFNLGSTVILLVSQRDFQFNENIKQGSVVTVGQKLGEIQA